MPRTAVLDGPILGLFRGVVRETNVESGPVWAGDPSYVSVP